MAKAKDGSAEARIIAKNKVALHFIVQPQYDTVALQYAVYVPVGVTVIVICVDEAFHFHPVIAVLSKLA